MVCSASSRSISSDKLTPPAVRLGKSGLKISKIILGCMSYGSHGWNEWVIDDQEEVTKHVKVAYVHARIYHVTHRT